MVHEQKKWLDIKKQIQGDILNQKLLPGDKLPRDSDMAIHYGVARNTVQRAMRELSQLGVIERRRKGGTYIAPFRDTKATIKIPVIQDEIASMGQTYGYDCILQTVIAIPAPIQRLWRMDNAIDALHIQCRHLADDSPYIYEDRWINTDATPDIVGIDFQDQSANVWLLKNRPYSSVSMNIYAINAPAKIANLLTINVNQSILVIDRTTWLHDAPITTVRLFTKPGYKMVND